MGAPASIQFAYFLKKAGDVTLSVLDTSGSVVKKLEASNDAGLNFVKWDLRKEASEKEKQEEKQPAYVEPGRYKIKLSTAAGDFEKEFEVLKPGN